MDTNAHEFVERTDGLDLAEPRHRLVNHCAELEYHRALVFIGVYSSSFVVELNACR